ncbi:hypothetical protein [Chromobacterium sp. CV08]|uniref:hypothetical protein n=1 Tax=Chromobacterium sp. CV08 TaxID=3133274 RepID=UPI003DAA236D
MRCIDVILNRRKGRSASFFRRSGVPSFCTDISCRLIAYLLFRFVFQIRGLKHRRHYFLSAEMLNCPGFSRRARIIRMPGASTSIPDFSRDIAIE